MISAIGAAASGEAVISDSPTSSLTSSPSSFPPSARALALCAASCDLLSLVLRLRISAVQPPFADAV
jgi:hypothetical protein